MAEIECGMIGIHEATTISGTHTPIRLKFSRFSSCSSLSLSFVAADRSFHCISATKYCLFPEWKRRSCLPIFIPSQTKWHSLQHCPFHTLNSNVSLWFGILTHCCWNVTVYKAQLCMGCVWVCVQTCYHLLRFTHKSTKPFAFSESVNKTIEWRRHIIRFLFRPPRTIYFEMLWRRNSASINRYMNSSTCSSELLGISLLFWLSFSLFAKHIVCIEKGNRKHLSCDMIDFSGGMHTVLP